MRAIVIDVIFINRINQGMRLQSRSHNRLWSGRRRGKRSDAASEQDRFSGDATIHMYSAGFPMSRLANTGARGRWRPSPIPRIREEMFSSPMPLAEYYHAQL